MSVSEPGVGAVLRARQVPRILGASLLGRVPLGSAPLALLLAGRESMSIGLAGALVGAYTAGTAAGQPLLSRLADRWRQPPVLWIATAVSTLGFLTVAAHLGTALALLAAAAAGLGTPPFESCLRVLWRDLVGERLLAAGYTVDGTAQELIFITGPLVTAGSVLLAGARAGLFATVAAQLLGTVLYTTAPAVRAWRGTPAPRHWAGPLRSPRLHWLLGATVLVGGGVGATTVAVAGYAEWKGHPSAAGWLLAAQAAGALIGGSVAARYPSTDPGRRLVRRVLLLAAGYLPLLLVPVPPVLGVALAVSGLALPAVLTSTFLVVDRVAPPGTAAESFAWVITAFAVGSATGAAADGAVLDGAGVHAGFLPAPLAILAAAALLAYGRPHRPVPESRPSLEPRSAE